MNYTDLSIKLTTQLSKTDKKNNGIYFTPPSIIQLILSELVKVDDYKFTTILEPSCGSCEFINQLDKKYKNKIITGIEKNNIIFNEIKSIEWSNNNKITILHDDFFNYNPITKSYDLIIGNPPFKVCKKQDVPKEYTSYMFGRPNLFNIFICHALKLLNENGILIFVLPNSFLNCLYYDNIRKLIIKKYSLLKILNYTNTDRQFLETDQETCIVFIQDKNNISNNQYILKLSSYIIFSYYKKLLEKLLENSTTIFQMNIFDVKVGSISWNTVKDLLTDDESQTKLLYPNNIISTNSIEKSNNNSKKQYIHKDGNITDPIIVVYRGYGNSKYKFTYALIDDNKTYLVENHLIYICPKQHIDKNILYKNYDIIIKSFENPKTAEFIKYYFYNNAINTTELKFIFPIFLN
jgi:hypothetical protein